jgi:4-hydroxyphenylpyruvate dioxygenase-like putative hemolysin
MSEGSHHCHFVPRRSIRAMPHIDACARLLHGISVTRLLDSMRTISVPSLLAAQASHIDHVSLAVEDLEKSIAPYLSLFGFTVVERLETQGASTGMVSAVLKLGGTTFVFTQGTSPESQVSQFITNYGPGVTHVAICVSSLTEIVGELRSTGVEFATDIIESPGLRQIFTRRDPASGLMIELIQRDGGGFAADSVERMFRSLESQGLY